MHTRPRPDDVRRIAGILDIASSLLTLRGIVAVCPATAHHGVCEQHPDGPVCVFCAIILARRLLERMDAPEVVNATTADMNHAASCAQTHVVGLGLDDPHPYMDGGDAGAILRERAQPLFRHLYPGIRFITPMDTLHIRKAVNA
jgi:hypothetical protein